MMTNAVKLQGEKLDNRKLWDQLLELDIILESRWKGCDASKTTAYGTGGWTLQYFCRGGPEIECGSPAHFRDVRLS